MHEAVQSFRAMQAHLKSKLLDNAEEKLRVLEQTDCFGACKARLSRHEMRSDGRVGKYMLKKTSWVIHRPYNIRWAANSTVQDAHCVLQRRKEEVGDGKLNESCLIRASNQCNLREVSFGAAKA